MKKVRVAMCWDDGVYTDLKAIEIFKARKAKAAEEEGKEADE